MKAAVRFFAFLVFASTAMALRAQDVSPFSAFEGNFSKHGFLKVSGSGITPTGGKVKIRFDIAETKTRARLKISGRIKLQGATRSFFAAYVFKPEGIAAVTNLAPGVDDGHGAEGTYVLAPKKITAQTPFVFGTTKGTATFLVQLKKRKRGTQLVLVQTLTTNALTGPITWKFQGLSRR